MKKLQTVLLLTVYVVIVSVLVGCSSAPTEKVDMLNQKMETLNNAATEYFVPETYSTLVRQTEETNALMAEKKYSLASAKADSALETLDTVRSELNIKGRSAAKKNLETAKQNLDMLLALLNDNFDALKTKERLTTNEEKYQGYNLRYKELESELAENRYLKVYRQSEELAGEIAQTADRVKTLLNQ